MQLKKHLNFTPISPINVHVILTVQSTHSVGATLRLKYSKCGGIEAKDR